jgi:predicted nucleic acid-binding protein
VKVLFDTNVVLDLLLDRVPFAAAAAELAARVERGELAGYLGATTITTVHYLSSKAVGRDRARQHVGGLLQLFEVAPVTRPVLAAALDLPFGDFEDAVLHEAAREAGARAIVTRDPRDFAGSRLAVFTPQELLAALAAGER